MIQCAYVNISQVPKNNTIKSSCNAKYKNITNHLQRGEENYGYHWRERVVECLMWTSRRASVC